MARREYSSGWRDGQCHFKLRALPVFPAASSTRDDSAVESSSRPRCATWNWRLGRHATAQSAERPLLEMTIPSLIDPSLAPEAADMS